MGVLRATPRHALTRMVGRAAGWTEPRALARAAIRGFAGRYALNLDEASLPIDSYDSVRALFTRALRARHGWSLRASSSRSRRWTGVSRRWGVSEGGELLPDQGRALLAALAGGRRAAGASALGRAVCDAVSRWDYHQVHASLGRQAQVRHTYIPGELWPVNPVSVASVPGLFALNERLVFDFETVVGRCALRDGWEPRLSRRLPTAARRGRAISNAASPAAGAPCARRRGSRGLRRASRLESADMGSTVVVCFSPGRIATQADGSRWAGSGSGRRSSDRDS